MSFTIPGLGPVDTRGLSGTGLSGVINQAGDLVEVPGGAVDVFAHNSATGALGATPVLTIPVANPPTNFFGMEQMALHRMVSEAGGVGALFGAVCAPPFASRLCMITSLIMHKVVAYSPLCNAKSSNRIEKPVTLSHYRDIPALHLSL